MKTRNGFVSNSSSTSFVVALKNAKKTSTKVKLEIEVDLKDYGTVFTNVEELRKYYKDELCDEDLDQNEDFQLAKKAIEKGKAVIIGSFSDECTEAVEQLLCREGLEGYIKDKNIEIIHSEAGY